MSPRPRATSDAEILAATHRAVSRLGPSLTLVGVAREAGVSPSTLVQRFGSKRELLLAFAAASPDDVAEEFRRIRSRHRSPIAAIYDAAERLGSKADTPRAISNSLAFLQIDLVDPDFHKLALARSRAMHAEIKRLLDEAITVGELLKCDTSRLARAVQSLLSGASLRWAIDRNGKVADRLREDLDSLLNPRHCPPRERRRHPRRPVRRV
jgi:AcrR family transcriptional regulator